MAVVIHDRVTDNQNLEEDLWLMRTKADALFARATDISTDKKRKREIDSWLKNAQDLKIKMEAIEEEVKQCSLLNHNRLRIQILKITKEMEELLKHNASSSFPLVTTEMTGEQFDKNLRTILSWFTSDEVSKIAIYGVGGVGKTTLATHIVNQLLDVFGRSIKIYWVSVTEECTISELQDKIAKKLGISYILGIADEVRRSSILSETFEKRGNVVLILDDVREYFSFEEIGITTGKNECKLLLTTRSLELCREMACQKLVNVEVLTEEESLSFFAEMLWNYDDLSNEVKEIVKLVAKECVGLPLGIIVVAASMRGVCDVFEWKSTLDELTSFARIFDGFENEVFPSLLLSYYKLKDESLQNCFLSCALFPEDYEFKRDELVNLWIMEGYLEEFQSRQDKLNMGHIMVNRLTTACLLDSMDSNRSRVKMHDLIRDMAITVSRQRHMIKAGMQLREVPRLQEWTEELTKVSLVDNNIVKIPLGMSPRCPNLSSLLLQNNYLKNIPDSFFVFLNGLEFLDLSYTFIKSVPDCISQLENLSSLKFTSCERLKHVPSLAKLTNLRNLDLSDCSRLRDLPEGMERLVNLEFLLLKGSKRLRGSFSKLTAGLSNIQCLELESGINNATVANITKLRRLERLINCVIKDMNNFNMYVQSQHIHQITSYRFFISGSREGRRYCNLGVFFSYNRCVYIEYMKFNGEEVQLPHNIQELQLSRCEFLARSLFDALSNSWTSLLSINVGLCEGIEYLWSDLSSSSKNLEKLNIYCLNDFRGFVNGRVELPAGAFCNLKKVRVFSCCKVEKLFAPCLLNGQLHNLEEIEIRQCIELVEIFELDQLDVEFPKLKVLCLDDLPKLVSICKTGLQVCCESIEKIEVKRCPELKKLPLVDQVNQNGVPPPRLEEICVEREWWESLVWDNLLMKQTLQQLTNFDGIPRFSRRRFGGI